MEVGSSCRTLGNAAFAVADTSTTKNIVFENNHTCKTLQMNHLSESVLAHVLLEGSSKLFGMYAMCFDTCCFDTDGTFQQSRHNWRLT